MKHKTEPALFLALVFHFCTGSVSAHSPVAEMAQAATNFLAALTPEQRAKAVFDFKNDERFDWHFIPKSRKGLPFKEMEPTQSTLAEALLKTALSQNGY